MKFKISKDALLKGLQMVQSVISVHSPTPVLFNVLVTCDKENLYLTATDMYITMRYTLKADINKKGATTIPARRLFSIIRELPEEQVEVEIDEKDTAMIESGSSSIKIFGVSAEDFPSMPTFKNERIFSVEQETFREMLRKTSYAVSNDESRPILNGVLLTVKDRARLVARRVVYVSVNALRAAIDNFPHIVVSGNLQQPTHSCNVCISIYVFG